MKWQTNLALAIVTVMIVAGNTWGQFTISVIDIIGDAPYTYPMAINNSGQIAGYVGSGTYPCSGFIWENGVTTPLTYGLESRGYAINNQGDVAGSTTVSKTSGVRSILWSNGQAGVLETHSSTAFGINDQQQVVGMDWGPVTGVSWERAVLWDNGVMQDLDTPQIGASSARAINNAEQIVGQAVFGQNTYYSPALWENGNVNELSSLGGEGGYAYAINELGQIVGEAHTASNQRHATLWENELTIDIGTLGGGFGQARGINDNGYVVGTSSITAGDNHAFIWDGSEIVNLETLIVGNSPFDYLSRAEDINNKGQIVGRGFINGEVHAFLLTPSNSTPVADAGGPYFLDMGGSVLLGGSDVGGYKAAWDLNLDGLFDDAFGLNPLISSDMFTSFGFGPGTWNIGLQVTNYWGDVDVSTAELTLTPVPSAVILGSLGLTFSGWLLKRKRML